MKPDIKEIIRNEYVHGYINDRGQRVMPTLDDLIDKYNAASSMFTGHQAKINGNKKS